MSYYFRPRHLLWVLPTVTVVLLAACGGSPSAPTTPPTNSTTPAPPSAPAPGGTGKLSVRITDSPFSEAKALLITFSEVSAHTSDENWTPLTFAGGATSLTCDLKRLVDAQDMLGSGQLAAGHYTQLRLTVSAATIYFSRATTDSTVCAPAMHLQTGTEVGTSVDVPSGTVKLVQQFEVVGSTTTSILLDFDGDKSVHQTGNGAYKMQPVIKVVSVQ
jgi:hypothetical protein